MVCKGHNDDWHVQGQCEQHRGRLSMSYVRMPRLCLLPVYSICTMLGQSLQTVEVNQQVVRSLVRHVLTHQLERRVAGDWNLDPGVATTMPWVERTQAALISSPPATCFVGDAPGTWMGLFRRLQDAGHCAG